MRELAHINHENESWLQNWSSNIWSRCFELISSKLKFWPWGSVPSLSIFIQLRLIALRYLIYKLAEVALNFEASVLKLHTRIDICFASMASEGTLFGYLNNWQLWHLIVIFGLRLFCKRLNKKTERQETLSYKWILLRCLYSSCSHIFGANLAFIYCYNWDAWRRRHITTLCLIPVWYSSPVVILI